MEMRTGPGAGRGKAAEGEPLTRHKDGCVDAAALDDAKRGGGHRLVVRSQQLLDCDPHQVNCLRHESQG